MKTFLTVLLFAVLVFVFVSASNAGLVTCSSSSFCWNTQHENFQEPIDYSNAVDISGDEGFVITGTLHPYTYSQSDVSLIAPMPNSKNYNGLSLPEVSVFNADNEPWPLSPNGAPYGTVTLSSQVPGNGNFLVEYGAPTPVASFTLTLPGNGATRVGFYPIMYGSSPGTDKIITTVLGLTGNTLGVVSTPACDVSDWANNLCAFQASDGSPIKSITITTSTNTNAGHPAIADLMFDPVATWTVLVRMD